MGTGGDQAPDRLKRPRGRATFDRAFTHTTWDGPSAIPGSDRAPLRSRRSPDPPGPMSRRSSGVCGASSARAGSRRARHVGVQGKPCAALPHVDPKGVTYMGTPCCLVRPIWTVGIQASND